MSGAPKRALVVYARAPVAGKVKTRLQPVFTPAEGLALYEAMLADLIERSLAAVPRDTRVTLAWSDPCEPPAILSELIVRVGVERQIGDNLGERMARTLQEKFQAGFSQVVLIGSDAPNVPLEYLRQSFERLSDSDLVLGPASDGGYYLLGARRLHPVLFQKMPWGTDKVFAITRQRVKSSRIPYSELPRWYDVDTPQDVERLWIDLQHMSAKRPADLPWRTLAVLASLLQGRTRAL